jgi:hypothetical protein
MTDADQHIQQMQQIGQDASPKFDPQRRGAKKRLAVFECWAIVLTITILVYSPVLSNFFNGDDFVHLNWLHKAVQNPDLVWRNFHSAWLDVPNARFYRPLISLFMLSDYVIWRGSGFGFHFTNLLSHLVSTVLLWLVLLNIFERDEDSDKMDNARLWAFLSATLFALYPLHPEAVSWITGRVDTIVTMFCLLNLWCYIKWRASSKRNWLIASCAAFICALLSKEMAVIQPALLVAYEFLLLSPGASMPASENRAKSIGQTLARVFEPTFPFWVILAGYFVVRYMSLGTLIGGYDDSVLPLHGLRGVVKIWLHSALITVLPFNKDLTAPYELLEPLWYACLAISVVLGIRSFGTNSQMQNKVVFLAVWLALSLIPLFKFFNISDDLQGSRLAYLPSVPLCALLCFGIAFISGTTPARRVLKIALAACLLLLSTAFLCINNSAWSAAGRASQTISHCLKDFYQTIPGSTPVFILGLPDTINGAYIARNALDGMTKIPQIDQDATNCFALDNSDRVFPFGIARSSLNSLHFYPIIMLWSNDRQSFVGLRIPKAPGSVNLSWANENLRKIISQDPHQPKAIQSSFQPDGTLVFSSSNKKTHPEIVFTLPQMPCWYAEYITLKVRCLGPQLTKDNAVASLIYSNDLLQTFDLAHRVEGEVSQDGTVRSLTFALHSEIDWAMGGMCHQMKLLLPPGTQWAISEIAVTPAQAIMPILSVPVAGNQNRLGYIELNPKYPTAQLDFNVDAIPEAIGVALELSAPNAFFQLHNTSRTEPASCTFKTMHGKQGSIILDLHDFKLDGIYEARLRALNSDEKQVGLAGDHVVITVNH